MNKQHLGSTLEFEYRIFLGMAFRDMHWEIKEYVVYGDVVSNAVESARLLARMMPDVLHTWAYDVVSTGEIK